MYLLIGKMTLHIIHGIHSMHICHNVAHSVYELFHLHFRSNVKEDYQI
jgi:hypothetical protein